MDKKRLICVEVEEKFLGMIIQFVEKEELTITNIKEAMEKVYMHMEQNATIKKTT